MCKAVIPVKHESFAGKGSRVAVCTLGSIGLLEEVSKSEVMMDRVAIVGRLLSENRGIDAIIQYALSHHRLELIVLCGREVKGHMSGQALLSLYRNGVNSHGRIIGATGQYPTVESTQEQVDRFRKQIKIMNMMGVTDISKIKSSVA